VLVPICLTMMLIILAVKYFSNRYTESHNHVDYSRKGGWILCTSLFKYLEWSIFMWVSGISLWKFCEVYHSI
jgi:hypothetical protein